jgi:hypothetical protein
MTHKNAKKLAARARKEKLGGKYQHHFRQLGGAGGANTSPTDSGPLVFDGTHPYDGEGFFVTDGTSDRGGPLLRDAAAVREHLSTIIVAAFEEQVPGRASATSGPGPMATVRYYVEGTPIVFSAIVFGDKIMSQIGTEPQGGILWAIKENPLTEDGARIAAAQMIAWLNTQIDIRAVAEEFNAYTVTEIRIALGQVAKHPLRGPETSYDAVTGQGKVSAGQPVAGVRIRRNGDAYVFRLTEVSGEVYSWDELTMKTTSFPGFVRAMRDLLRK